MFHVIKENWEYLGYSTASTARKDCITIKDNFSSEELLKLKNWCLYINWEIKETEEYKESLLNKELLDLKELAKKWEDNMSKYKTVEAIPAEIDPNRDYKLNFLQNRANELTAEYLAAEYVLVEKYGVNILDKLV